MNPIRKSWHGARAALARLIAPARPVGGAPRAVASAARMYASAKNSRLSAGFGSSGNTSADAELNASLTQLRARSRQMIRDSAYAKRASLIVVNNVIGSGIGLQAKVETTRGQFNERVNADIEAAFCAWCCAEACHTGGALHFGDLERMAMEEVFAAGEVLIRTHYSRFGDSKVPLALEVIEAERLGQDIVETGTLTAETEMRMGVEVDRFGRALYYWIRRRHPGDLAPRTGNVTDWYERVPADQIFHLRRITRWPQTRGEPWLHAVLRKLDDMNEYSGSEVAAARASAYYFATITSPNADPNPMATAEEDDQQLVDIEPLTVQALKPGEELEFHSPNRPNTALDPFMRAMLREISAGCGPSYESLSRDYSQSNYSSSRLALLDDRDLWRTLQSWWIRSFRMPLHAKWLQQAVLARAVGTVSVDQYAADTEKYAACAFKPRGWSWVDPTREVKAYKEAIAACLTTTTDVIAQTAGGQDIEDIVATRKRELQMFEDAGIEVDTTVAEPVEEPPDEAAAGAMHAPPADAPMAGAKKSPNDPQARVVPFGR